MITTGSATMQLDLVIIDTSATLWLALVTGLGTLAVLVWQAVRYFRRDRRDRD